MQVFGLYIEEAVPVRCNDQLRCCGHCGAGACVAESSYHCVQAWPRSCPTRHASGDTAKSWWRWWSACLASSRLCPSSLTSVRLPIMPLSVGCLCSNSTVPMHDAVRVSARCTLGNACSGYLMKGIAQPFHSSSNVRDLCRCAPLVNQRTLHAALQAALTLCARSSASVHLQLHCTRPQWSNPNACVLAGTFLLDIFDHYVSEYGFFIVGALESLAIGWVWGWHEVQARCGTKCASAAPWNPVLTVLLHLASIFLPLPGGCHVARCVLCSTACARKIAVSAALRMLSLPGPGCAFA